MGTLLDSETVLGYAYRLKLTRIALKLTQAEICRQTSISPTNWNNAEKGDNRLGYDAALSLCRRYGLSFEWLVRGNFYGMPEELRQEIARLHQSGKVQITPRPSDEAKLQNHQ